MRLPESAHLPVLTSLGIRLDTAPQAFGELYDANAEAHDMEALRQRLSEDGYLLLRGLLDRTWVQQACAEVAAWLHQGGYLLSATTRIATPGASVSPSGFAPEQQRFPTVRRLTHTGCMLQFYTTFLGTPVRAFDYIWMRCMAPGQATGPHCDIVYMGRGTTELYTSWTPLTPVTINDGPLLVLERSHQVARLRDGYGRMDIDKDANWSRLRFRHGRFFRGGDYSRHPRRTRAEFGLRWLTTEFDPGDVLILTPYTMHASLDNRSPRFRLSIDTRYQRAAAPIDERWNGAQPLGHTRP
jgi:hypothetical protein